MSQPKKCTSSDPPEDWREEYEEALRTKVLPYTVYEVQRKTRSGIWMRVHTKTTNGVVRGYAAAYALKKALSQEKPHEVFRVVRQDQADHYREGLAAAKKTKKPRHPLLVLPENL
jgi:ABC-type branched-subunit amino acid transport system substrate-binding protein